MTNGVVTLPLTAPFTAGIVAPTNGAAREFVAGPENRLAAATIERLVAWLHEDSSTSCTLSYVSPVVFHGAPGTGKSLLVRSLADAWKRQRPEDNVVLLTAAEFAQQYAEAVDKRAVASWRTRFRTADLLVLEDLLHLATKAPAQSELLHTLDELADRGAWVVVTSRLSPHELTNFLPGLQSRLQAGLCVPLVMPEVESRQKILAALCAKHEIALSNGSLRLLARSLAMPAPELSGVLASMELTARSTGRSVDDKFVQAFVIEHCAARHPPLRTIATQTARHFALRVTDLRSTCRRRGVVTARDIAMYLSRQLTGKSLKQIGEYFGGRDHTTVLHGCRKTESLMRSDPATLDAVTALRQALAIG